MTLCIRHHCQNPASPSSPYHRRSTSPHCCQNPTKKTQTTVAVELSRRRLSSTETLQLTVANKHSKSHSKSLKTSTHTDTHSKSHRWPFAFLTVAKPSLTVLTLSSPIHFTRDSSARWPFVALQSFADRSWRFSPSHYLRRFRQCFNLFIGIFFFTDEIDFFLKFLLREEFLKVICLWVLVSLLSFDSLLMFEFIFTYSNYWCGSSSFGLFH